MNKRHYSGLCAAVLLLAACAPQSDDKRVMLDLGDLDDYEYFLEDQGDIVEPVPFEPEPLFVSAIGKVQAKPDIAVITATITAENKNESYAVNEMGEIINAVQTALKERKVETGFTEINSNREFDPRCQNENSFARRRHNEIRSDYNFNKRLDDKGDTETKRRRPKKRVAQAVCRALKIKVSTNMVIRIQPADQAGDVLRALSNAGAENSRLFGYDFTDYDALYQEAAAKAVTLAREKANTVARIAGGTLGEIESFSVSAPERKGRFGPQPNVIRPANEYQGQRGSVIDRHVDDDKDYRPSRSRGGGGGGSAGRYADSEYDEIIVTARKQSRRPANAAPKPVKLSDVQSETSRQSSQDRVSVTSRNRTESRGNGNTNALSISLLSGPQTISVAAQLGYTYETPLNGKIIKDPDQDY